MIQSADCHKFQQTRVCVCSLSIFVGGCFCNQADNYLRQAAFLMRTLLALCPQTQRTASYSRIPLQAGWVWRTATTRHIHNANVTAAVTHVMILVRSLTAMHAPSRERKSKSKAHSSRQHAYSGRIRCLVGAGLLPLRQVDTARLDRVCILLRLDTIEVPAMGLSGPIGPGLSCSTG